MKNVKVRNGYYLDDFSSTDSNIIWSKLISFVNENKEKFSSINIDKENNEIILTVLNEDNILDLFKNSNIDDFVLKNLNRKINLNLTFDKSIKNVILSEDNVENFKNFNEVSYSIDCKNINNENTLFFHESALVNYTENDNISDFLNSNTYLCLFSFDEDESIYHKETGKIINLKNTKEIFLCLNRKNDTLINDTFKTLNNGSNINIEKFINVYNDDRFIEGIFDFFVEKDDTINTYKFSNFKMAASSFNLPNGNEEDFLNFKNYSSYFIYNSFINNLRKSLEKFW